MYIVQGAELNMLHKIVYSDKCSPCEVILKFTGSSKNYANFPYIKYVFYFLNNNSSRNRDNDNKSNNSDKMDNNAIVQNK